MDKATIFGEDTTRKGMTSTTLLCSVRRVQVFNVAIIAIWLSLKMLIFVNLLLDAKCRKSLLPRSNQAPQAATTQSHSKKKKTVVFSIVMITVTFERCLLLTVQGV